MVKKVISVGAEAQIILDNNIIKDRVKKGYRLEELDKKLRQSRTRREVKVLLRLEENKFPAPRLVKSDKQSLIEMEYLDGKKVRDVLNKNNFDKIAQDIGKLLAKLHNLNIAHGDLTTSNMIMLKEKVFFIDFGLSVFSRKVEDKAVDVHLFRQALESKHNYIWRECYNKFVKAYFSKVEDPEEIKVRLDKIESRGRNKSK